MINNKRYQLDLGNGLCWNLSACDNGCARVYGLTILFLMLYAKLTMMVLLL